MGTTYDWNNAAGGAFGVATNWSPNGVPGTLDTAVFDLGAATYTVSGDGTPGIIFVVSDTVTFTGSIETFGTGTLFTDFVIDDGTAIFNAGTLTSQREVQVGGQPGAAALDFINGAVGTLTASNIATALDIGFSGTADGNTGTPGTGSVLVDNSTLTANGGVYVGVYSAGTLTVTDNALVQIISAPVGFDTFEVGVNDSSVSGTVTVDGGATLDVGVLSDIGVFGQGTVAVSGATLDADEYTVIGDGGSGIVSLSDGATGSFTGLAADGTSAYSVYLGGTLGSGTLSIDGAATSVNADSGMLVGEYGNGLLTLTGGATLAVNPTVVGSGAYDIELGSYQGATGTLLVSGSANLTGTAALFVGEEGTGSLDISTGGTVYTDGPAGNIAAALGFYPSGDGTGVIDNGLWDDEQSLSVGYQGSGTLTVQDSGVLEVDNGFLRVARDPGSTGTLTVDAGTIDAQGAQLSVGPDSISILQNTTAGTGGSGTLEIENSSTVFVGGAVVGGLGGGSGSIDITGGSGLNINGGDLSTGAGTSVVTAEDSGGIGVSGSITIGGGGGAALVQLTSQGGLYDYGSGITIGTLGTIAFDASAYLAPSGGPLSLDGGTLDALASRSFAYDVDITGGSVAQPSAIIGAAGAVLTLSAGITFVTSSVTVESVATVVPDVLLAGPAFNTATEINDFAAGDTIDLVGSVYNTASYDVSTQQLILSNVVDPLALNIADNGYSADSFSAYSDGNGGTDVSLGAPPCYVAGTLIATPDGERAVESLRAGDRVSLAGGGSAALIWVGGRWLDPAAHPRPWEMQPIRIRRDALAPGLPARNLWLSPDHALLLDGVLVEAKRLVNGRTIVQESGWRSVHYLHLELARHDLLLAEGVAAESYLDTGNRFALSDAGGVTALHPSFAAADRRVASCAPLATDPAVVQAIWQRLAERAARSGVPAPAADESATADAAVRLQVDGRSILPLHLAAGRLCFAVPSGARRVRLTSRAAMPAWQAPWLDDRRCLGLNVSRLRLHHGPETIDLAIDSPSLGEGWWDVERCGAGLRRWTGGNAAITLPFAADFLEITASTLAAYPLPLVAGAWRTA